MSPRAKKTLTLLIALIACGVIAELGWGWKARAALADLERSLAEQNPFLTSHPDMAFILKPGDYELADGEDRVVRFHINAHSLRGPEIELEKAPGTTRILCLGGSTTFGTGCLTDAGTYPTALQRELEQRLPGRDFEVLNAGTSGYTTVSSLFNLARLAELEPDIVILYQAINDISSSELLGEHYFEPGRSVRPETSLERRQRDCERNFVEMVWNRLGRPGRLHVDAARANVPQEQRLGFGKNLVRLAKRVSAQGARLVFVTFETQITKAPSLELRAEIEAQQSFRLARLQWDALREELRVYNQVIRAKGRRLDVPVLELEGRLLPDEELWRDFLHPTDEGSANMARVLAEQLAPLVEKWRN